MTDQFRFLHPSTYFIRLVNHSFSTNQQLQLKLSVSQQHGRDLITQVEVRNRYTRATLMSPFVGEIWLPSFLYL